MTPLRETMTTGLLTVDAEASRAELEHLVDIGRVHHVPVMDDDRLVGLWVAGKEGLDLLGIDSVLQVQADAEAMTAFDALAGEHEAVLVRSGPRAVGMVTRTDLLDVVRRALTHGLGARAAYPVVLRMIGPPGAGTTSVLARTLPLLPHCETVVVVADADEPSSGALQRLAGTRVLHAPEATWHRGLYGWIERLAPAQLILVEEHADLSSLGGGAMDDVLVLVVPADALDGIAPTTLNRAAAVVVTRLNVAPVGFDLAASTGRLRATHPTLAVFGIAADDSRLREWADWIERKVLARRR